MQKQVQISSRNISLSEAAEKIIREKAEKLNHYYNKIIGCRVMVETLHKSQHKGTTYHLRLDITVQGGEIVVNRQDHEDLYVVIKESFHAARRQLEDYAQKQRGEVKVHREPPHGNVIRLFPEDGYGFIEGRERHEVYFHRNAVVGGAFDTLEVGSKVRYVEVAGSDGPQASSVVPV